MIGLFSTYWNLLCFVGVFFLLILYKFMFMNNVSLRKCPNSPDTIPIWELQTISPLVFSFLRDSAFYFFL